MRVAALAASAALLAAPAGFAQENAGSADILGAWGFDASPTYPGCYLSGEAVITRGESDGAYACRIVANDICPDVWSYRAEETCTATRKGDQLTIESRLDSVEPETDRYLPDNFVRKIVNGSLMVGELRSAMTTSARFVRQDGPIG